MSALEVVSSAFDLSLGDILGAHEALADRWGSAFTILTNAQQAVAVAAVAGCRREMEAEDREDYVWWGEAVAHFSGLIGGSRNLAFYVSIASDCATVTVGVGR